MSEENLPEGEILISPHCGVGAPDDEDLAYEMYLEQQERLGIKPELIEGFDLKSEFQEDDHPRADDGKFSSNGGSKQTIDEFVESFKHDALGYQATVYKMSETEEGIKELNTMFQNGLDEVAKKYNYDHEAMGEYVDTNKGQKFGEEMISSVNNTIEKTYEILKDMVKSDYKKVADDRERVWTIEEKMTGELMDRIREVQKQASGVAGVIRDGLPTFSKDPKLLDWTKSEMEITDILQNQRGANQEGTLRHLGNAINGFKDWLDKYGTDFKLKSEKHSTKQTRQAFEDVQLAKKQFADFDQGENRGRDFSLVDKNYSKFRKKYNKIMDKEIQKLKDEKQNSENYEFEIDDGEILITLKSMQWREEAHPRTSDGKFGEKEHTEISTDRSPWASQVIDVLPDWKNKKMVVGSDFQVVELDDYLLQFFQPDYEANVTMENYQDTFDDFAVISQLGVDLENAYNETNSPSRKRKITELSIMYTEIREGLVMGFAEVIEKLNVATKSGDRTDAEWVELIQEIISATKDLPSVEELKKRLETDKKPAQERV